MTKVYQTRRGKEGNCWAACLASILEVPLSGVDHCGAPHLDWAENTQAYLSTHGLYYVEVELGIDATGKISMPMTALPDGTLLIVGCNTERELPHAAIGQFIHETDETGAVTGWRIEIVHDPMPGGSEEYVINSFLLLCRRF